MDISDLLCSSEESSPPPAREIATCEAPRTQITNERQGRRNIKPIPEDQRKRPYRMSMAQKEARRESLEHESRVFNLTLDINGLKQQVEYLLECRDLQVSCLLQTRQHLENEILNTVDKILFGEDVSPRYGDVSQRFMDQLGVSSLPNGVYELHLQLNKPNFDHQSFYVAMAQVMAVVEEDQEADDNDAAELRKICTEPGSCLVEVVGEFTGRFTRQILVSMFPHVLSNEMMVAQIIGLSITCPARLLLYFNARRIIVLQIAQADVLAALTALQETRPREFSVIMGIIAE